MSNDNDNDTPPVLPQLETNVPELVPVSVPSAAAAAAANDNDQAILQCALETQGYPTACFINPIADHLVCAVCSEVGGKHVLRTRIGCVASLLALAHFPLPPRERLARKHAFHALIRPIGVSLALALAPPLTPPPFFPFNPPQDS
jgi:hypothetical protein